MASPDSRAATRWAPMIDAKAEHETLVLTGPVTIRTIGNAYDALTPLTEKGQAIAIDCRDVTEADLTLVQLLLAARRSAEAAGTGIKLTYAVPGPLYDALVRGGLVQPAGDAGTEEWDSFWREGAIRQ